MALDPQVIDRLVEKLNDRDRRNKNITLKTRFNRGQLSKLYKELLAHNYIETTTENDFIYQLSGKPLYPLTKINWIRAKKEAMCLLDQICLGPRSFITINNCLKSRFSKFDSNDGGKKYDEIEKIIESIEG